MRIWRQEWAQSETEPHFEPVRAEMLPEALECFNHDALSTPFACDGRDVINEICIQSRKVKERMRAIGLIPPHLNTRTGLYAALV